MLTQGLDPGAEPAVPPLCDVELEQRRTRSGLAHLLPQLRSSLQPVIEAEGLLMVVTDTDGRVLWRSGQPGIRHMADGLGFVGGSAWSEPNVGTNAIGTCLVLGSPVHVQGAEHYVETHTRWGCSAAPLYDPWTERVLGVLDISGPAHAMRPAVLALVTTAARLAALEVKTEHTSALEGLRAHATPLLARVGGRSLVVDQHGHIAAVTGMSAPQRVPLPAEMTAGAQYLPALGAITAEALPGGWLLRLHDREQSDAPPTHLELDLRTDPAQLQIHGPTGSWTHALTPRHAEILLSLLVNERGRSAAELASDLFADPSRAVTVRAEMTRLRRTLTPVLRRQPYRIDENIHTRLVLPASPHAILPHSNAPIAATLRERPPPAGDRCY
jgi:transcriptional regulator of acetoin/glycerol metabolism